MGFGSFAPEDYAAGVQNLRSTGQTFARSQSAAQTGNYKQVAEILDPRKLKKGVRECCFADGFQDALPIVVSIDCTGSMETVPHHVQQELPKLIGLLTEQGVSDHPNVLFMGHDDEHAIQPDAVFQMSQFETGAPKLLESLNEMIIPGQGGGNQGEAYHLSFYAAARHTHLEANERDGHKGFFFMICDEEPYYHAANPGADGTSPAIAKEVFGDTNESVVTMLDSVKEVCKRYHVFIIRPGHTSHGRDRTITQMWQKLLREAGENPEHVLEIPETEALIPTIALTVGSILGADRNELVEVLRAKGSLGVDSAANATNALVPVSTKAVSVAGQATDALVTAPGASPGHRSRA